MPAAKGNCYNPKGRPEKEVDWVLFEQLCQILCTQSEICSMLKINHETLEKKCKQKYKEGYSQVYKRLSESGKCSLRRNQFVLSKKNATMAIFLGKVLLKQREDDASKFTPPNDQLLTMVKQLADQNSQLQNKIETLEGGANG